MDYEEEGRGYQIIEPFNSNLCYFPEIMLTPGVSIECNPARHLAIRTNWIFFVSTAFSISTILKTKTKEGGEKRVGQGRVYSGWGKMKTKIF